MSHAIYDLAASYSYCEALTVALCAERAALDLPFMWEPGTPGDHEIFHAISVQLEAVDQYRSWLALVALQMGDY
jgi:hypothetical protein